MLIIISDLHLNDGTTNETISAGAFKMFAERVRDAAEWVKDQPKPVVDIVLLGDILDVIRSTKWNKTDNIRPWDDPDKFLPVVTDITNGILEENKKGFQHLKALPRDGDSNNGVRFRLHYLVGNHDWFFHLPGKANSAIGEVRKNIIDALGLSSMTNKPGSPFPHDTMTECPDLLREMKRHRVLARHGDIHDPSNFTGDRNRSSIGDAVVIELLNALVSRTVEKLKQGHVPDQLIENIQLALREVDNLRPYTALPSWLNALIRGIEDSSEYRDHVEVIRQAINDTLREQLSVLASVPPVKECPFIQRLKITVATKVASFLLPVMDELSSMLKSLGSQSGGEDAYQLGAYREQLLRAGEVDYVVYGHTHHQKVDPLDHVFVPGPDGGQRSWFYLNSGTWRPVHLPCKMQGDQDEFSSYHTMTYLVFYTQDEWKDHPFDTWTGQLAHTGQKIYPQHDMYVLTGRLLDRDGQALSGSKGYRVKLFDRDLFRNDDLGEARPDDTGNFSLGFFGSEFQEPGEGKYPEPLIEVWRDASHLDTRKLDWPRYAGRYADVGEIRANA